MLKDQGKFDLAEEPFFRRALKGWERTLVRIHSDKLTVVNNLGLLLQSDLGKLKEAEPFCRRALEGRERIFGASTRILVFLRET